MQKKKDNLLDKIVKKDYNNELEEVLEKKYFTEDAKNLLLSILYKIEVAYKDYEKVKPDVETKEELIRTIIDIIKKDCDEIKIVKLNSKESEMLGNKTFLVEKNKKRIICYPIERKLLYCISKIDKKEKIIKGKYPVIDKTLSSLINAGNNINTVEPMRDFNGYSWTTIPKEIESIYHNLIYQNIRILIGEQFLNQWIQNKEYIIDYFESFSNKLEDKFNEGLKNEFIENLCNLSVLLAFKFDVKLGEYLKKEKKDIDKKLLEIEDNPNFIRKITEDKKILKKEIKEIDEIVNNKQLLQEEYKKRNEFLPIQKKIFSIKILSKMMADERAEKIKKLEEKNALLNPQKFVAFKRKLEEKGKYLKLLELQDIDKEMKTLIIELQKIFLSCYKIKIEKANTKQEVMKQIYEYRYYCLLPFYENKTVKQVKELNSQMKEIELLLIEKAHEFKIIDTFSKNKEIDYELIKNIFGVRVINLEEIYIKLVKEKDKFYIGLFDEEAFEEKIELNNIINKKDLNLKLNKKVKIFN